MTSFKGATPELPYTQAEALELFAISPYEGGDLGWILPIHPRRDGRGKLLDTCKFKGGRVVLDYMGVKFSAARVVWLMHTGVWPMGRMGIRNHNQADIRFANLYLVDSDTSDLV